MGFARLINDGSCRTFRISLFISLWGLVLSAFSPDFVYSGPPPKSLVMSLSGDPKTFNILVSQESTSSEVGRFLFEGLTDLDPLSGEIQGRLAHRWDISPDGLQWVFHLRRDVRWSDGQAFNADDVIFTFEVMADPALIIPARDIFTVNGKAVKVKRLDDWTVEFTLPEPFAPFLLALGQPILPKHLLSQSFSSGTFAKAWGLGEKPDRIAGTGPFKIRKYVAGQRIELEKNPYYWKTDESGRRLPRLEQVLLLIVPSPEVKLLKFMEGSLDVYMMSGRDYPVLKPLETARNFSVLKSGPGLGSNFLVFNQGTSDESKRRWFKSRRFREAAAHALDRQSLVEIVLNRLGAFQCSPLSPSIPYYYTEVPCRDFDPARTRELLRQEGFDDRNGDGVLEDAQGKDLEFVLMTNAENSERVEITQMVREDLARAGMKVHLLVLEFNALVSKLLGTGDWDAVLIGFTGASDPHFGANVWKTQGSLHFWEPKDPQRADEGQKRIDEIFAAASGLLDRAQRKALYDEWQQIAGRDLPLIYTILPETLAAVSNRLLHIKPSVLGGLFHNLEEIDTAD